MARSGDSRRVRVERGIYRQPNGKFAVCVRVNGRARFRTLEAVTLAEAREQRELLQDAGRRGLVPLSPRLTFAEVAGRWLAEFEAKTSAGERRDRTFDLYRSQLHRHLLPRLGRRRLALITADDVANVMRELQAAGLSPWTVKRILAALSCVFTFALRRGYVNAHPFDRLERDERPHPLRSGQRVLTATELTRLFAACPRRYRPLLLTGAYTGMRLSEMLGLSWEDLDFHAGIIRVRHQLARGRRGVPPYRIPPKTRASVREIPLLPQLAAVLRQHKRGCRFTGGCDYVFATANGTPFLHHNVSKRVLRRAAIDSGLDRDGRRVRFHDLRHTFASHLIIDIRLDVVQVSRILGHARTSMTLDTYTHLFEAARHGADVRAELARSKFAMALAPAAAPTAHARKPARPRASVIMRGRARGPACRPGRARTPSRSASQARRRAAAASVPRCCAGRSRSVKSPSDSFPSARQADPG